MERYLGDRKILLYGKDDTMESYLVEKYGKERIGFVTSDPQKANDEVILIDQLKDQKEQSFLYITKNIDQKDLRQTLKTLGLKEFKDFLFLYHKPIVIRPATKSYKDSYGNVVRNDGGLTIRIGNLCCNAKVIVGASDKLDKSCKIYMTGDGGNTVIIEENCHFHENITIKAHRQSEIIIGKKAHFHKDIMVIAKYGTRIQIGPDTLVGYRSVILAGDGGHPIYDLKTGVRRNYYQLGDPKGEIVIGQHVWVGIHSIILNSTHIGNGSIIGAGSVFKGTLGNNCVAGGNPAKLIREGIVWGREPNALTMNEEDIFVDH